MLKQKTSTPEAQADRIVDIAWRQARGADERTAELTVALYYDLLTELGYPERAQRLFDTYRKRWGEAGGCNR